MAVQGIGIYTRGKYLRENYTFYYRMWADMLRRCTCEKYQAKYPNYTGCSVDKRFLHFQDFMDWCSQQIGFGEGKRHLDKDFVCSGNKVYSPENCVLLPPEINTLFGSCKASRGIYPVGVSWHKHMKKFVARCQTSYGRIQLGCYNSPVEAFAAYKEFKESHVKAVAKEMKDLIDERVYNRLLKYEVKEDD